MEMALRIWTSAILGAGGCAQGVVEQKPEWRCAGSKSLWMDSAQSLFMDGTGAQPFAILLEHG